MVDELQSIKKEIFQMDVDISELLRDIKNTKQKIEDIRFKRKELFRKKFKLKSKTNKVTLEELTENEQKTKRFNKI